MMDVQMVDIEKVIPYSKNPRKNAKAIGPVKTSIEMYGFRQPLVLDKDMVIVVGHTRFEAAKQLGYKEVPCVVAKDLTKEQAKAYRIADNKSNEYAAWDIEFLKTEWEELKDYYTMDEVLLTPTDFATMLDTISGENDPDEMWDGMPEHLQDGKSQLKCIVHFPTQQDRDNFFALLQQKYTDKTKYVWFPPQQNLDTSNKEFVPVE